MGGEEGEKVEMEEVTVGDGGLPMNTSGGECGDLVSEGGADDLITTPRGVGEESGGGF